MSRAQLAGRNVLATLMTQVLSWAMTFAVTLYLPRYVGDIGLGKLAFASSFVMIFGVIAPLGTSTVLIKEIARDHARTAELLTATLALRVPIALMLTGVAIASVWALGYSALIRTIIVLASLGMVIGAVNDALSSALQGQEKMPRQSLAIIVEKFLSTGLTIAFVIAHAPLWAFAGVGLFTGIVSILVNLTAFRTLFSQFRWPSKVMIRHLAIAGLPFMGWTVFRTLYGQSDPVVLKFMTDDATVGWYAAAFRLIGTSLFFPVAITTALLPTLSRLHQEGEEAFQQLAQRMLALVMLCGIPISLLFFLAPDHLIALMHYPAGFRHSIPVLRVGGIGVLLYSIASVLGTVVIASDRQHAMFRTSVIAALVGIPACFLGAYVTNAWWHNGAIGAIISDIVLEVYLIASYLQLLPAGTFNGKSIAMIGRCAVAALPAAAFWWLSTENRAAFWIIPSCIAIYMGMCWALRCISHQDIAVARQFFSGRMRVG